MQASIRHLLKPYGTFCKLALCFLSKMDTDTPIHVRRQFRPPNAGLRFICRIKVLISLQNSRLPNIRNIVVLNPLNRYNSCIRVPGILSTPGCYIYLKYSQPMIAPVNMGWIQTLKLGTHCLGTVIYCYR